MFSICVLKSVSSSVQKMKSRDLSRASLLRPTITPSNLLHILWHILAIYNNKIPVRFKYINGDKTLPIFLLYHFATHKSMFRSRVNIKSTWDKTLVFNILWKKPQHHCTAFCDEAYTYETAHKITPFEELQWKRHHRVRWNCDNQNVSCCFCGLEQSFLCGPLSRIKPE